MLRERLGKQGTSLLTFYFEPGMFLIEYLNVRSYSNAEKKKKQKYIIRYEEQNKDADQAIVC